MSRLIDAIETLGDWTVAFAENFNTGVVGAVEKLARAPRRVSGWSLDGLTRSLLAVGRLVAGVLRIAVFYVPAAVFAFAGHLSDRQTWVIGAGIYAMVITGIGIAGHFKALRRSRHLF